LNKICKIINSQFSYILEVDEQKISFNGGWNADYFVEHYKTLGYEVKRLNHNSTFGYDEGCPGCGCKDGNHAQECKVYYTKGYGKR